MISWGRSTSCWDNVESHKPTCVHVRFKNKIGWTIIIRSKSAFEESSLLWNMLLCTVCSKKKWSLALNEKSSGFFSVNFFKNWHVSTYTMYKYVYEIKKMPRMATLIYSHFGNPSRSYHRAHYSIVNKKARELSFLPSIVLQNYSDARECKSSGRGALRLAAAH